MIHIQGRPSGLKTGSAERGGARNFRACENHGRIWASNLPMTLGGEGETTSAMALVALVSLAQRLMIIFYILPHLDMKNITNYETIHMPKVS